MKSSVTRSLTAILVSVFILVPFGTTPNSATIGSDLLMTTGIADELSSHIQTWASFRVVGKSVHPQLVTREFGIAPTRAHDFAEQRSAGRTSEGQVVWNQGLWLLSSRHMVQSKDLDAHLTWLIEKLEPARKHILRYTAQTQSRADVFAYYGSELGHGGPRISAATLEWPGVLGVDLEIDFYYLDE